MNAPLFSVVIPLYNKERMVEATIRSVLNQTEGNFELIVVNDGSTDRSAQVVRSITDGRIRLIDQENGGVSSARNKGIAQARGKYICFLDADDRWYPDFLSEVLALAKQFPSAGMLCPSYEVKYANRTVHPKFRSVSAEADSLVRDVFEMATGAFWVMNSSCVAMRRRDVLQMDRWFPTGETVYEDFDFWLRFGCQFPIAHGKKVCAVYNRETEVNARKQHSNRVVYSKTYMNTLTEMMRGSCTAQQRKWLQEIYDRRIVPYVFSLLMTGDRYHARQVLARWVPIRQYRPYKCGLTCASITPHFLLDWAQWIRMKLF